MVNAKNINLQKLSVFLSVVAFGMSFVSLCVALKTQNSVNSYEIEDIRNEMSQNSKFKPIDKVPDVEIIKADGSIDVVNAVDSKDKLVAIIEPAKNDNQQSKYVKQNVKPVERETKAQNDKKTSTVATTNEAKKNNEKENAKETISGKFVIQIGAFKNIELAKTQCQKAQQKMNFGTKKCIAVSKETSSRSIVYPFASYEEATKFAQTLSQKAHISSLVKKNVQ